MSYKTDKLLKVLAEYVDFAEEHLVNASSKKNSLSKIAQDSNSAVKILSLVQDIISDLSDAAYRVAGSNNKNVKVVRFFQDRQGVLSSLLPSMRASFKEKNVFSVGTSDRLLSEVSYVRNMLTNLADQIIKGSNPAEAPSIQNAVDSVADLIRKISVNCDALLKLVTSPQNTDVAPETVNKPYVLPEVQITGNLPGKGGGNMGLSVQNGMKLQNVLNSLKLTGKDGKPLTVDGRIGPNTMFAIQSYKTEYNMPQATNAVAIYNILNTKADEWEGRYADTPKSEIDRNNPF